MSNKETYMLSDPLVEPTMDYLSEILGEKFGWWMQIRAYTMDNYPNITEVWKYYNDGKQWYYRLMQKKNTIFWLAVMTDTFRITYYFPRKAEPLIANSTLPDEIREEFLAARTSGKIRPISVRMCSKPDVELVFQLTDIKLRLK